MTKFQKMMERAAWVLAAITVVVTLVRFHGLPYRVPTHFDALGQPDAWGERSSVFLLAGMVPMLCGLFSWANRLPLRWVNLPFKVRPGREEAVLSAVRDVTATMQVEAAVLMLSIQLCTLLLVSVPAVLMFGITAVMLVTVVFGIWRCWKRNK